MKENRFGKLAFFIAGVAITLSAAIGIHLAFASLTFTGTNISGDSGAVIDATGTISIGTSTATGITIGSQDITTTFPGSVAAGTLALGGVNTVRSASVVIAASNSPNKGNADVVCSGTNDQVCINNAITSYCSASAGCDVVLQNGTYNLSGSIVVGDGNVTLQGEERPFWGGYNHSAPCSTESPCGSIGVGGAQLVATTTGFNLITVTPTVPCGVTDTSRCRAITFKWLYLIGDGYTQTGIYDHSDTDNEFITENVFQRLAGCIDEATDAPDISGNSCQDNGASSSSIMMNLQGDNERVSDNLIWDDNGDGIHVGAPGAIIQENELGDLNSGVVSTGNFNIIADNRIVNFNMYAIEAAGQSFSVANNTLDMSSQYPNPQTGNNWIVLYGGGSGASVTGNVGTAAIAQTGYFIHEPNATISPMICDNDANGTFSNGAYNFYGANSAAQPWCPNSGSMASSSNFGYFPNGVYGILSGADGSNGNNYMGSALVGSPEPSPSSGGYMLFGYASGGYGTIDSARFGTAQTPIAIGSINMTHLLIGTATDNGTDKVQVNGDVNATLGFKEGSNLVPLTSTTTPTVGAGVCWKTATTLGTCTAGTWPNCTTCN